MYMYVCIFIYETRRGETVYTSSKKKRFQHYLILKNTFQKYCGTNISATTRPILYLRKTIYIACFRDSYAYNRF